MNSIQALSLVSLILLSGCTKAVNTDVINKCVSLCHNALKEGRDLSNGPCLSDNNTDWKIDNWVCDVAHSPRQTIDNQRENQCREWWEGYEKNKAPSFVEVTPDCEFIRTG